MNLSLEYQKWSKISPWSEHLWLQLCREIHNSGCHDAMWPGRTSCCWHNQTQSRHSYPSARPPHTRFQCTLPQCMPGNLWNENWEIKTGFLSIKGNTFHKRKYFPEVSKTLFGFPALFWIPQISTKFVRTTGYCFGTSFIFFYQL